MQCLLLDANLFDIEKDKNNGSSKIKKERICNGDTSSYCCLNKIINHLAICLTVKRFQKTQTLAFSVFL